MQYKTVGERSVADLNIEFEPGTLNFSCVSEKLTSLEGSPQVVNDFLCQDNELLSLEGGPQTVHGNYLCSDNKLTSLKGAPREVGGVFSCSFNYLTSLEHAPRVIGGGAYFTQNNLTSLRNIHRHIERVGDEIHFRGCDISSHVLGLLLIKDLKKVVFTFAIISQQIQAIVNAHLDGGSMRSAMDCQHALIKAGYPEYARL